jgi:hypothetical protein
MKPTAVRVARHRALGRLRGLLETQQELQAQADAGLSRQTGGAPSRPTSAAPRPEH